MRVLIEVGDVTQSNIGDLRNARIGEAVLLTGGSKYELVTQDHSLNFIEARTKGLKRFVRLSTTQKSHSEAIMLPGRFGEFQVTLQISARLVDPIAFVSTYGHDASLLAPFHKKTISDIRSFARDFDQTQVHAFNSQLQLRFESISNRRPVFDGVELQEYVAVAEPDPRAVADAEQADIANQLASMFDRFGPKGLALLIARYPQHEKLIKSFSANLLQMSKEQHIGNMQQRQDVLEYATRLQTAGVIEADEMAALLPLSEIRNEANETSSRGIENVFRKAIDRPKSQAKGDE